MNLLGESGYGLLVEALDGRTYAPHWDEGRPLVVSGADALTNFDDALNTIREALGREWGW